MQIMPLARLSLAALAIIGLLGAGACLGEPATALAQAKLAEPATPRAAPAIRPDRSRDIEFLFGALKAAPDATAAKAVESRILSLWLVSGSDTADLLMSRAKTAADEKDLDLAIRLLDAVVDLRPGYVEGWNRRATLQFLKKDYGRSLADIRQVLVREPRHFGALVGLGSILQELGEDKFALEAFRRAVDVHPHLERVRELLPALVEKVEGRPI